MRHFSAFALAAVALVSLTACQVDSERVATEAYLQNAEPIAQSLVETGGKFETLINANPDPLEWSADAKAEMQNILAAMTSLSADAKALTPPEFLATAHPLLVEAIAEMQAGMTVIADAAANPSAVTEASIAKADSHAEEASVLGERYVSQMETAINAKYPDLLEDQQ
ncbi:MAG: hypothetical protein KBC95_03030 [Candidatus Peribacteraceae bacterium]|nr:hypothetical protein [Candidatus Peribacteraceae bacterium]